MLISAQLGGTIRVIPTISLSSENGKGIRCSSKRGLVSKKIGVGENAEVRVLIMEIHLTRRNTIRGKQWGDPLVVLSVEN